MSVVRCEECFWRSWETPEDSINHALWPLNTKFEVFIDFNLMLFMSVLQHESPSLSHSSLLKTLQFMPALSGKVYKFPNFLFTYYIFIRFYELHKGISSKMVCARL